MKTIFVAMSALVVFVYSLGVTLIMIGRERWKAR